MFFPSYDNKLQGVIFAGFLSTGFYYYFLKAVQLKPSPFITQHLKVIFAQGETHLIKWSGLRAACESCVLLDAAVVNGAFPGV